MSKICHETALFPADRGLKNMKGIQESRFAKHERLSCGLTAPFAADPGLTNMKGIQVSRNPGLQNMKGFQVD